MKSHLYVGPRRFEIEVRRLLEDPENRTSLRRALDDAMPGGATYRMSDAAVVAKVASMLESGQLRLQDGPRIPTDVSDHTWDQAEVAPPPAKDAKKAVETTWIEIRLIGEDKKPIPGERYRIELPDGSVREGSLNDKGAARVEGIDPGQCEVTFPALDKEAWVKA